MMVFPAAFAATTVDVQVGADTASWSPAPAERADARTAMDALVAWCNNAARAWYGAASFDWAWSEDGAGGALLRLRCSTPFAARCTGTNPLHWPSAYATPATTVATTAAAPGTWAPAHGACALGRWLRQVTGRADGTGTGAVRGDTPGAAAIRPTLTAACTTAGLARLQALLVASESRTVQVWQVHESAWRAVRLGRVDRGAIGRTTWRLTFDCRGVA